MSQPADIQERIAAARRESEQLKEKIRARRELTNDTSCKLSSHPLVPRRPEQPLICLSAKYSEGYGTGC